jgi:hypothetical protein
MASLFSGIDGFPLIWSFLNGKENCVWSSEIEGFCRAVSRIRFPDTSDDKSKDTKKNNDVTGSGVSGRAISFQERNGCPGGGKGILIQDEHTGALTTLQNQFVCYEE